jgi:class 3 adenylate cyclase
MSLRTAVLRRRGELALPEGTVTFLLTDVEASNAEWDADADRMETWLRDLDRHLRDAVAANGGCVIKSRGEGDSAFAVFDRASSAVLAAYELQRGSPERHGLSVRAAIHTGEARVRDGDYFGVVPNRTARLRSLAHGGQTITSRVTADLAEPELPDDVSLYRLGTYRVRDWPRGEQIFELRGPGLRTDFPSLRVWWDAQRALTTIVIADLRGSLAAFGGTTESETAAAQRALSHALVDAFNEQPGSFYKFMGDGCLALFDEPLAAIGFARAVISANDGFGVSVHAGVLELAGDDVVGQPLYTVFHANAAAGRGEIVTTPVVADLLAGHGLAFTERVDGEGPRVFVLN